MRILPLLLLAALAVSCSKPQKPPSEPPTEPPPVEDPMEDPLDITTMPETIPPQVQRDLAAHLEVPTEQIEITGHSRETWSDGCLGLGGPAESCLAALTEGWQVNAQDTVTGDTYIYRTDLAGNQIRREP